MKVSHLFLVLAAATFVSCERHDFKETRVLSEPHGAHASHADGAHGDHTEGSKDEHAPKAEH